MVKTLLYTAIEKANLIKAFTLINAKADVTIKDDVSGLTSLHLAVIHDKYELLKTMISHNVDVDIKSGHSITPLELAIYNKNIQLVKLLLYAKANPNAKTVKGKSMLELNESSGLSEISTLLRRAQECSLQKKKS